MGRIEIDKLAWLLARLPHPLIERREVRQRAFHLRASERKANP